MTKSHPHPPKIGLQDQVLHPPPEGERLPVHKHLVTEDSESAPAWRAHLWPTLPEGSGNQLLVDG